MKLLTRAEEFVLISVWQLQGNAYSIPIRERIKKISGEKWSLGAVYMPLERLEKKGLLTSYFTGSTPERGGRQKRIYQLTDRGKQELIRIRQVQSDMWADIPELSTEAGNE